MRAQKYRMKKIISYLKIAHCANRASVTYTIAVTTALFVSYLAMKRLKTILGARRYANLFPATRV